MRAWSDFAPSTASMSRRCCSCWATPAREKRPTKSSRSKRPWPRLQWTRVANRDAQKTYNPKTSAQLAQMAPAIDWHGYFTEAGLSALPTLVVRQPDYLQGLSALIAIHAAGDLELLLSLPRAFEPRAVSAARLCRGRLRIQSGCAARDAAAPDRWKRGTQLVDRLMGEASGKLYVAKYFPPATKARIDELVRNLLKAYALEHRSIAVDERGHQGRSAGEAAQDQRENRLSRSLARLQHADDLAGRFARQCPARAAIRKKPQARAAGRSGRSLRMEHDGATVNAYYNPSVNEIVFPRGNCSRRRSIRPPTTLSIMAPRARPSATKSVTASMIRAANTTATAICATGGRLSARRIRPDNPPAGIDCPA